LTTAGFRADFGPQEDDVFFCRYKLPKEGRKGEKKVWRGKIYALISDQTSILKLGAWIAQSV
jgi:hypothetical protein